MSKVRQVTWNIFLNLNTLISYACRVYELLIHCSFLGLVDCRLWPCFPPPPFGITALTTLATGRVPLTRDCQTGELWSRLHRCDDLLSGGIKIKGAVSSPFGWCDSALRADHWFITMIRERSATHSVKNQMLYPHCESVTSESAEATATRRRHTKSFPHCVYGVCEGSAR